MSDSNKTETENKNLNFLILKSIQLVKWDVVKRTECFGVYSRNCKIKTSESELQKAEDGLANRVYRSITCERF